MALLPFDERPMSRRCPKCDKWVSDDEWRVRYDLQPHDERGYAPARPIQIATDAHLHWSCPNCGYYVMTETADATALVPA